MQSFSLNVVFCTIISVLSLVKCSTNSSSRTFVRPCSQPGCLKSMIQSSLPTFVNGYRELGIESLDPFIVDNLELMLPGGLKIAFRQGFSKGLRKCIVDSASMVEDNVAIQFHCNLTIKGKYKSSGRLLMFAVDGDGDSLIKCRNIKIQCNFKLGSTMRDDGQTYLEITNIKTRHSFDGQVIYKLTNLIKGNPEISKVILSFMNTNWRLVAEEFGKPIVDFGVSSVLKNVKNFFKIVPMNDIIKV